MALERKAVAVREHLQAGVAEGRVDHERLGVPSEFDRPMDLGLDRLTREVERLPGPDAGAIAVAVAGHERRPLQDVRTEPQMARPERRRRPELVARDVQGAVLGPLFRLRAVIRAAEQFVLPALAKRSRRAV